jgi:hypothetical protein
LIDLIFGVLTPLSAIFCAQLCKLQKGCTLLAAASDKVYQFLAHGRWFSPASSTTKTGRHDIALLKKSIFLPATFQKIKT